MTSMFRNKVPNFLERFKKFVSNEQHKDECQNIVSCIMIAILLFHLNSKLTTKYRQTFTSCIINHSHYAATTQHCMDNC